MSKYLYSPLDIALFFKYCDFTLSDEKNIKDELWENRHILLEPRYRKDKYEFINKINLYLEMLDEDYSDEFEVINRVLREFGSKNELGEIDYDDNYIESYFRFVKLRLTYVYGCDYVRLKLRTLLREFGYKRRTKDIVNSIKRSMKNLKLECYLKGYEPCDVGEIKLEHMIMIRLKE